MKRIPEQIVAQIKEANDIVSVVEQYVPLPKKSGSNYFGLCPFHNEDTPSFSVNPGKQIYYCFGCHKGGDVINFVKEIEHCDYPAALRLLAQRAHIEIPEIDDSRYREEKKQRDSLLRLMNEAAIYYYHCLFSDRGTAAQAYLHKRRISANTAKRFGLGYAPSSWDGLYKHLSHKGYAHELLMLSGLFKTAKNGRTYDLFRERLMFPILSAVGKSRVIAFGGRVLDDSLPKYINSPETPVYNKSQNLYALNLAKRSRSKRLLLVEGYLDVISLHQAGFDQAVAPLGTAFTPQQAKLIHQFSPAVTLGFDADRAGQNAIHRAIALLEKAGVDLDILQIPDGKDPDDYIRSHGADSFGDLLQKTISVMQFRLLSAERNAMKDSYLDPQAFLREIMQFLPDVESASMRELYLSQAAQRLGVSLDSLKRDVEQAIAQQGRRQERQQFATNHDAGSGQMGERDLRAAMPSGTSDPSAEQPAADSGRESELNREVRLSAADKKAYTNVIRLFSFLALHPLYQKDWSERIQTEDLDILGNRELAEALSRSIQEGTLDASFMFNLSSMAGDPYFASVLSRETLRFDSLLPAQSAAPHAKESLEREQREELERFFAQVRRYRLQKEQAVLLQQAATPRDMAHTRELNARLSAIQAEFDALRPE